MCMLMKQIVMNDVRKDSKEERKKNNKNTEKPEIQLSLSLFYYKIYKRAKLYIYKRQKQKKLISPKATNKA